MYAPTTPLQGGVITIAVPEAVDASGAVRIHYMLYASPKGYMVEFVVGANGPISEPAAAWLSLNNRLLWAAIQQRVRMSVYAANVNPTGVC